MLVSLRRALSVLAAACISFLPPLVSAQSVLQPIPTSPSGTARAAAVNPVTNRIYVLNEFDNSVSVVDGKTRAILATVTVGTRPEYIAVNPYTNRIYVSQGDASLSVINGADNTVATYPVGATGPVVADPYSGLIYNVRLSTAATDEVTIFDDRGTTPTWHSVSTQSFEPVDITLDPMRHWYYVVHYPAGHVRQIDATSTADTPPSTQIDVGKPADLIAGNPITNFWYVLTENSATPIAWVDGSNDTPGGFAPTNGSPTGPAALAVNTVTNKTYAAFSTGVYVIDGTSTNPVFIPSGSSAGGPAAIGINKTTNKIYVANSDGTLTIIDGDTNAASTVAIPTGANYVTVNPITNRIYVTNSAGLTEIDGAATDTAHANPLQTTITPFASNASTADATFTFNASTAFAPSSMPIQRVYYQVDATDGPWQLATGSGPYTGTALGLAPGSHTVYAFAVDGQDAPLTGKVSDPLVGSMASYTFKVGGGTPSSTSLITSKNPAFVGDSVTFTASVTGSAGAPTGSVDFLDGGNVISACRAVALSSGTAACTVTTLTVGTHSITARYSGNATYDPSTSSAITETVNPVPVDPTLALTSSANPSTSGQAVTFTLAISGPNGTATGTVNFLDGATAIGGCSAVAVGGTGSATCTTSTLALGTHSITAQYSGDAKYHAGTSNALSQQVNAKATTTTALASSLNPSTSGQSVTLTASVTASSGTPTGTVDFLDGGAAITSCTGVSLASGSASCVLSTLAVGTHSLTARYSGSVSYLASTSSTLSQTVNPQPGDVTMSLTSTPNPSTAGSNVTFNVTLSGASGAVTGSVTFNDGSSAIAGCTSVAISSGAASCATSALAAGSHTVTASYSGSTSYNAGTSAPMNQVVNPAPVNATIALTSSLNPSNTGDAVTFTATVSGGAGTPTGTVTFNDGSNAVSGCSSLALSGSGTATCATSTLSAGTHSITAAYSGSASYNAGTSSALSQVVNAPLPNVALASAGATATASSQLNASFPVAAIIDGDETGANWSAGGGWADGTLNQYPDWVQVQFASAKQVQKVVVVTLQDNWQSPVQPTDTMTFTQYGVTDFTVQGWDGSAWQTLATVTGNNLVKRTVTFSPFNTDRIRIRVTNALASLSRIVEVEAYGADGTPVPPPNYTNVALASTGATATASSTYGSGFPVSAVINGDRKGTNWGAGGGWADATVDTYPDWVEVDFSTTQSIDHVSLYTLQDNWQSPVEPTDTMTFTQYGVTDYQVQAWNGSQWVTLGAVSGNNLVKSTVWFDAVSTSRIRVNVTNALASLSRITEIEAFSLNAVSPPPPPPPQETNVALASTGAVASASSTFSSDYPVSAINDNERAGVGWSTGGGWADGTANQFPDWVEVDFNGAQAIDKVVVYTLQDNWQNPVEPTDTMTFTQYGGTDFTVQAWDGSQWLTVGTVSGNNLVKRTVSFTAVTATKIRINVTNALSSLSRITEVEAWGTPATTPPAQTNWALASNGAHAAGSSQYSSAYPASAAINGDRAGTNWGAGGGWADGTPDQYPDTLEVDFAAAKTIDHVIVYTVQDNWQAPVEPTDTMTFTQYGVTDFDVQGWNGAQWVTLGSVTGNNFVKRNVPFSAFTTDRIRIVVNGSLASLARITEVEAWGN